MDTIKYFFTHYDNIPEGLGYGLFTIKHFVLLLITILFIILTVKEYKKSNEAKRIKIRKIIAFTLIIIDVIKLIIMYLNPMDYTNYLPLEICSFAAYSIVLDSIYKDNKFFSEMLLLLFLPAAMTALLVPTTTALPIFNFFTIHQFLYHALIIAYVLMRYLNKEIKITYIGLWKSILKTVILASVIYCVDYIFNKNYMFLMNSAGNPALNIFYNLANGGKLYLVYLVIFVIFVLHLFYLLFKGLDKLIKL